MEKINCVSCNNLTWQRIKHKETKKEYPLCVKCISDGLYNEDIFDVILVRGEIPRPFRD